MATVGFVVNGKPVEVDAPSETPLLWAVREHLKLTGTKFGCGAGLCGACTVHVDGRAVRSCRTQLGDVAGKQITTIEGLAKGQELHPMQAAFREHHGLQCGFCTPGMIMAAVDMVNRKGNDLDDKTIREELEGNICRCTGYHNIVKAIHSGAEAMGAGK